MPRLPMFPLGTVLFPHMVLPLHVFEPRYRQLLDDVLPEGREFGVVLITRGHEVGGGEARSDVGTVAKVVRAEELDDGRWVVIAVGTRRLRVRSWLPDDPYPLADVEEVPELPASPTDAVALRERLAPRLRRVLALQAELGEHSAAATLDLAADPDLACWQAAVAAPLTPFDAQAVLETGPYAERVLELDRRLAGVEEVLAFRLAHPPDGTPGEAGPPGAP